MGGRLCSSIALLLGAWGVVHCGDEESPPPPSIWQVIFGPNIDVSDCRDGVQWCCQNIDVEADGTFQESWAPSEPETAIISGTMTESAFQATLACTNGAYSGNLTAARAGDHYEGSFDYAESAGGFMVVPYGGEVVVVQGGVTSSANFSPVAGATVTASVDDQASATTNANGMFLLVTSAATVYSNTPYTISISAAGFQPFSQERLWGDHAYGQQFQLVPE